MTQKQFYKDCHMQVFSSAVTGCTQAEKGYWITLDETAFYPEGGGQGCDFGTLAGANVLDVQEQGEEILHLCDAPLAVGEIVEGRIDWARRFDFMQQHTGEHILSGLLHQAFGCHNVGFHIGAENVEVDFDCNPSWEQLMALEAEANAIIWRNLPIICRYPCKKELATIAYRSKKALAYPVRLVEIPGVDICACCGVHTATTGEVGVLKILSCTKFHQGVRLEMVCGNRAYRYFAALLEQARQVSQICSAKVLEIGGAAEKLTDSLRAEKLRANTLQTQILEYVACSYVNQPVILHFTDDLPGTYVRQLADKLANKAEKFAAVLAGNDSDGYQFCLVARNQDLRALGKAFTAQCHGRGGGKPEFQQGSVQATAGDIRAFLDNYVL